MKVDGRCHCGYVSFEAEADPDGLDIPRIVRIDDVNQTSTL